jgi:hypothetical protein
MLEYLWKPARLFAVAMVMGIGLPDRFVRAQSVSISPLVTIEQLKGSQIKRPLLSEIVATNLFALALLPLILLTIAKMGLRLFLLMPKVPYHIYNFHRENLPYLLVYRELLELALLSPQVYQMVSIV